MPRDAIAFKVPIYALRVQLSDESDQVAQLNFIHLASTLFAVASNKRELLRLRQKVRGRFNLSGLNLKTLS